MKKVVIAVSVIVTLLIVSTALAALPGTGWSTNVQVQNVGTATANVQVSAYSGGAVINTTGITVPVGGSTTILATAMGIGTGYQGAGVLSSDQPLFGILFVTNFGSATGNTASAIVRAVNAENTATTLSFPLAKKNFGSGKKTTTFYIQNAGTANASITATMAILSGSCTGPNPKTYTNIIPGEQVNFTPQDLGCVANTYGSVSVVSNGQPLAGIVLEHDDSTASPAGGSRVVQGTRGFAPADADTRLIAPIIKKSFGANKNVTGLQVQNVSGVSIPAGGLVVTYTVVQGPMGVGTVVTETNSAAIADLASFNSLHPTLLAGTLASAEVAVVNSAHKIVGIVNENRPSGTTVFRNTTYSLLAVHDAATSLSLPLVKEFFGGSGGRCTGVQVVPVGGTAILELTYKATSGQVFVVTTTAAVGTKTFASVSNGVAGATVTGGTFADMKTKNFGVTAKSLTTGVKLVAVANESFCAGAARDEDDANYEGFPLP